METATATFVPATGNAVLAGTIANLAAINDQLTSELASARMEISRLGELLKSCNCSGEGVVTRNEKVSNYKPRNYKTVLCTHFEKGACTRGDKCHFAHGAEELRKIPEN